jgi:integrase
LRAISSEDLPTSLVREVPGRLRQGEVGAVVEGEAAKTRKAQFELELARSGGTWVPPTVMSFTDWSEQWHQRYAAIAVHPNVATNDRRRSSRHVSAFGAVKLAGVIPQPHQSPLAARAAKGAAASTIRNDVIPLRECLQHAVDDGLIPANPASRVPIPKGTERKVVPPTRAQVEATLAKARKPDALEAITLAASLGFRLGELFALKWGDVDFAARLIHVRAANWRGEIEEPTKTEAGERTVPCSSPPGACSPPASCAQSGTRGTLTSSSQRRSAHL